VKLVFRLDALKTGLPPVSTADVSCTMRATYSCRGERPDIVSRVCGVIAAGMEMFVFVWPNASMMKEKVREFC